MLFEQPIDERERYIQTLIKEKGIDAAKLPAPLLSGFENYHQFIDGFGQDVGLPDDAIENIKRFMSSAVAYSDRLLIALMYAGELDSNHLNEGTSVLSMCLCEHDIQLKLIRGELTLLQLLKGDERLQVAQTRGDVFAGDVSMEDFLHKYAQIDRPYCTRSAYS